MKIFTIGAYGWDEEDFVQAIRDAAPNLFVEPGTMFTEQTNLLDLRFSKILRFAKYRTSINLDLANAFNSSGVTSVNNNFAAWQVPTGIHQARIAKISAQFDF